MAIVFKELNDKLRSEASRIHDYYIETGTAAFADRPLSVENFSKIFERSENLPTFALVDEDAAPDFPDSVAGFCCLSDYLPFSTFSKTACVSYFILPKYAGTGLGSRCLALLEEEAKKRNIDTLIADVSSENVASLEFHRKRGFVVAGELKNIGEKFGRRFGVVYLQKQI